MNEYLELLEYLYGLSPQWREGATFEFSGSGLLLYRTGLRSVPGVWSLETSGLPFLHLRGKHLKPTTCAARVLAPYAAHSVLEIESLESLQAYLGRNALDRSSLSLRGESRSSVPLVTFRGVGVGTARLLKGGKVESLFPTTRF